MSRNYRRARTDTQGMAGLTTPYKTQQKKPQNPTHSPLGATDLQIKGGCPASRRDQEQFPPLLLTSAAPLCLFCQALMKS